MKGEVISSASNQKIKLIRSLSDRSSRKSVGLFVADGDLLAMEALSSGMRVREVLVDESRTDRYFGIIKKAESLGVDVTLVSDRAARAMSETVSPQGILALVELPRDAGGSASDGLVLILDGIADPGNAGTIIRTADAVGARSVIFCEGADPYSPKTVRASMGSIFHIDIKISESAAEEAQKLKKLGYIVAGTHLSGVDPYDNEDKWQRNTALVIGSEAQGMSPEVSEACDVLFRLPMPGRAESLNASIAAAIFSYEWYRNNR